MKDATLQKGARLGPVGKKILLCLAAGATLSLTSRPDYYFRILKATAKEWQRINQRNMRQAIRKLYQSRMIDCRDNRDGTTTLTLAARGETRILQHKLDDIRIKKAARWDGMWRIIIFDIPENQKRARDALSLKLKHIGMMPLQKSVFVSPYECRDEIDFISEVFLIKPYVRYVLAKDIDVAPDLKRRFRL